MLSKKQNLVINWLQRGGGLITDHDWKEFSVYLNNQNIATMGLTVFFNLLKQELIYQGGEREHFNYILTQKGKDIKTKDINP